MWDMIIHPCPNFIGLETSIGICGIWLFTHALASTKFGPLNLGVEWTITPHFMRRQLLIHALIAMMVWLISVSLSGPVAPFTDMA